MLYRQVFISFHRFNSVGVISEHTINNIITQIDSNKFKWMVQVHKMFKTLSYFPR